ncbi:MAG: TolC family protein [Gemmatimonadaceae bacterium]
MPTFLARVSFLSVIFVSSAGAQSKDTLRLSLDDAVNRAVKSSDDARIAAAQVSLADAQITTARATGLPQLRVNSNYNQVIKNARAEIVGSIFGQPFNYTSSAQLSQALFQGGRVVAGSRVASQLRGAARFNERETRDQLSVGAQRSYLQALLARQLVEIQERTAKVAENRVAQIEQLEKAGRVARFDVLRSRVERANLEPALLQARNNRELAELALRQLLNIPADQPLHLTAELDTSQLRDVAQRVIADTGHSELRPAVRAAQLTAEARHQGIRVARADYLPTITTSFTLGYTALPTSNGFPTIWGQSSNANCPAGSPATRICQNNGWYPDRSFGVQMSWNIFDGLRTKGNVEQAQAQARIADLQFNDTRRQAETDRAAARAEFVRAQAAFDAQRQNAAEAQEAYTIAALRFDRGLSTLLEVTDAQNALFTAQVNAARASVDYFVAMAELARNSGREIPLAPTRPSAR